MVRSSKSFNCGGYALNTLTWYLPFERHDECDNYFSRWLSHDSSKTERNRIMNKCVEYMLNEFDNLRRIDSLEDAEEDENVIAFRIGDADFHFMVRKGNHRWYHKRGWMDIETISQEKVLAEV